MTWLLFAKAIIQPPMTPAATIRFGHLIPFQFILCHFVAHWNNNAAVTTASLHADRLLASYSDHPTADDSDGNKSILEQCCGDDGITACRPSACKLSAGFTPVFSVDVQKKEISGQSRNNKITEL